MQEKKHVELKTLLREKKPDYTEYKTIEIEVDIIQPTSEYYTEVDYELELEKKKKNNKSIEKQNYSILEGLNLDDDYDVDVRDMAAKFEVKYGGIEENSRAKNYEPNFGGYESNSFIDNTEAFDEHIPCNIVPLYGGMYINNGPLEFIKEEKQRDETYTRVGKYRSLSIPKDQLLKELNQNIFTLKNGKLHKKNKKRLARKSKIEKKKKKEDKKETKSKQPKTTFPLNSFENMFQILNKENEGSDRAQIEISSSDSDQHNSPQNEVKLPTNVIPSDVVEIVENIKKVCGNSLTDKMKNKELVNNLLLKLEYKCKRLKQSSRIEVYDHLALIIKCKRKSLTKRIRLLHIKEGYRKANEVLEMFKIAVIARMASLQKSRKRKASMLFVWNDETKELLIDVMDLQRNCFQLDGKRNDTVESRLVEFVKAVLLPIWPKGWMSARGLMDYYNSVCNEDEKLSVILEQPSSAFGLLDSIAPFQGDPSSNTEIQAINNINASASGNFISIDLTD